MCSQVLRSNIAYCTRKIKNKKKNKSCIKPFLAPEKAESMKTDTLPSNTHATTLSSMPENIKCVLMPSM